MSDQKTNNKNKKLHGSFIVHGTNLKAEYWIFPEVDGRQSVIAHIPGYLNTIKKRKSPSSSSSAASSSSSSASVTCSDIKDDFLELPQDRNEWMVGHAVMGHPTPRMARWHQVDNLPYKFSKRIWRAFPWPSSIVKLRNQLNSELQSELIDPLMALSPSLTALNLNSVLVNRYNGGLDHIDKHSDDEPFFGVNPTIVSISCGAKRKFVLERWTEDERKKAWATRNAGFAKLSHPPAGSQLDYVQDKNWKSEKIEMMLGDGDLMIMGGATQDFWKHFVPLDKKEKNPNQVRFNMTWRPYEMHPKDAAKLVAKLKVDEKKDLLMDEKMWNKRKLKFNDKDEKDESKKSPKNKKRKYKPAAAAAAAANNDQSDQEEEDESSSSSDSSGHGSDDDDDNDNDDDYDDNDDDVKTVPFFLTKKNLAPSSSSSSSSAAAAASIGKEKGKNKLIRGCRTKENGPPWRSEKEAENDWNGDGKDCLSRSLKPLRDYQKRVAQVLLQAGVDVFAVLHPMGAGKTLEAIAAAECALEKTWQEKHLTKLAIVVAPATLLGQFYKAILGYGRSHSHINRYYRFFSPENASDDWKTFVECCRDNFVIIDEFHELRTAITQLKPLKPNNKKRQKNNDSSSSSSSSAAAAASSSSSSSAAAASTTNKKKKKSASVVHWPVWNGPVRKGRKAAAVLLGAQVAWKVLVLTGTAVVNGREDLTNLATLYERGPKLHKSQFTTYALKEKKVDEQFKKLLHCRLSYLQPSDVKTDMPTWTEITALFEMSPDYYREYMVMESKSQLANMERLETLDQPGAFNVFLRQVSNLLMGQYNPKIPFIVQLLESDGWPMIVTTAFKGRGVQPLIKAIQKAGFTLVVISGDESAKKRSHAQELYNSGKAQVIILTKAGSTGWDLHKTKTHVNIDVAWHDAGRRQAMFRGIRVGSHVKLPENQRHVTVYNLILAKPTEIAAVSREIQNDISKKRPGASHDLLEMYDFNEDGKKSTSQMYDDVEPSDLPAVDVVMYRLQQRKADTTADVYKNIFIPSSIESGHCKAYVKKSNFSPPIGRRPMLVHLPSLPGSDHPPPPSKEQLAKWAAMAPRVPLINKKRQK